MDNRRFSTLTVLTVLVEISFEMRLNSGSSFIDVRFCMTLEDAVCVFGISSSIFCCTACNELFKNDFVVLVAVVFVVMGVVVVGMMGAISVDAGVFVDVTITFEC